MSFDIIENNLIDLKDKPYRSSQASVQASRLGLTYLGFGRYGLKKDGAMEVTHKVNNGRLVPIVHIDLNKEYKTILKPQKLSKFQSWKNKGKYEKSVNSINNKLKPKDLTNPKNFAYDDDSLSNMSKLMLDKIENKLKKILKHNTTKYIKKIDDNDAYKFEKLIDDHVRSSDEINKVLYTGEQPSDRQAQRDIAWRIREFDNMFEDDDFKVEIPYSVYTGTAANIEKGKNYIFKGMLSTTTDPNIAAQFVEGKSAESKGKAPKQTIIQIDLKPGNKAIDIQAFYQSIDKKYDMAEEREHLLPRNTNIVITEGPLIMDNINFYRAKIVQEKD